MLQIAADQVERLQGPGGVQFTGLMDRLIAAHLRVHGLVDSVLMSNLATSIPDGGVDTLVEAGVPSDKTGWFTNVPTCWQYKATDYKNIGAREHLFDGPEVQKQIRSGKAFRLAVAVSMPPATKQNWEREMLAAVRRLNPEAPEPRILTADDIARFATFYPAVVLEAFHSALGMKCQSFDAWKANQTAATQHFFDVPQWNSIRREIANHIDLSKPAAWALVALHGEAGVGKSRLVLECVAAAPGAKSIVLYCNDEASAVDVATLLANRSDAHAILVADECGPQQRLRLSDVLIGHRHRVRVVAIDNSFTTQGSAQPELTLQAMSSEDVAQLLELNFPHLSAETRRANAALASGFPRLAVDLCMNAGRGANSGASGSVPPQLDVYLRGRLSSTENDAMAALSLVMSVGRSGDSSHELDDLCELTGLKREQVESDLQQIGRGPGFVTITASRYYVTPEIVAALYFELAWRQWASDPTSFLGKMPNALARSFQARVSRSAGEEVRRSVAAYFRSWADAFTPSDLVDPESVERLVVLVETRPEEYLGTLSRIVASTSDEQLAKVLGRVEGSGRWGPRRILVWLAERLASFPEYFDASTGILQSLARTENEQGIANNASAVWKQLHRLHLSGTAVPFSTRLAKLRRLLAEGDIMSRRLAAEALSESIESHFSRILGPPVVAGRVPPAEWNPSSRADETEEYGRIVEALSVAAKVEDEAGAVARGALIDGMRVLVARGLVDQAMRALHNAPLGESELVALVEAIDTILAYDGDVEAGRRSPDVAKLLADWRGRIVGDSLHRRVVVAVGKNRWAPSRVRAYSRGLAEGKGDLSEIANPELASIARVLVSSPELAEAEMNWLTSDAAQSCQEFGLALAAADVAGQLLPMVLAASINGSNPGLGIGYARGMGAGRSAHIKLVNEVLDKNEQASPRAVVELSLARPDEFSAFERAIRLFKQGKIPAGYLFVRNFVAEVDSVEDAERVSLILELLAGAAAAGVELARRIGLDSLAMFVPYDVPKSAPPIFEKHAGIADAAWVLVSGGGDQASPLSHWWRPVVVALGRLNPDRACELTVQLLASDDFSTRRAAEDALEQLAVTAPRQVLSAVGRLMLDNKRNVRFFLGSYRGLFAAIPEDDLMLWLKANGAPAAQALARHLPLPYLDGSNQPALPRLTEWVLREFEGDDRVFHEFVAGAHSFQVYSGDIVARHEQEAATARLFLNHPLRRVREWAAIEERDAAEEARRARMWDEDERTPR